MEKIHRVKIADIVAFMEEVKTPEMAIRIERPEAWKTDPRRPAIVLPGLGLVAVHGGNHRHLVVKLEQESLRRAEGAAVLESVDLDLETIRDAIRGRRE